MVSLNISAKQYRNSDFICYICDKNIALGFAPMCMVLEEKSITTKIRIYYDATSH